MPAPRQRDHRRPGLRPRSGAEPSRRPARIPRCQPRAPLPDQRPGRARAEPCLVREDHRAARLPRRALAEPMGADGSGRPAPHGAGTPQHGRRRPRRWWRGAHRRHPRIPRLPSRAPRRQPGPGGGGTRAGHPDARGRARVAGQRRRHAPLPPGPPPGGPGDPAAAGRSAPFPARGRHRGGAARGARTRAGRRGTRRPGAAARPAGLRDPRSAPVASRAAALRLHAPGTARRGRPAAPGQHRHLGHPPP